MIFAPVPLDTTALPLRSGWLHREGGTAQRVNVNSDIFGYMGTKTHALTRELPVTTGIL